VTASSKRRPPFCSPELVRSSIGVLPRRYSADVDPDMIVVQARLTGAAALALFAE